MNQNMEEEVLTKRERAQIEKLKKIDKVVKVFLANDDLTIIELSEITGISKSAVQRYLNSVEVIELYGKEITEYITKRLKMKKIEGNSKGGKTTQKLYGFETKQNHYFNGSNKSSIDLTSEVIDLTQSNEISISTKKR